MKRREFIAGIGVAATWPMVARAQQKSKPVIGVLNGGGVDLSEPRAWGLRAFSQGLRELGYVEGSNVLIEYRGAQGKVERFPALAAELVALNVDVIVTAGGTLAALAAKQATTTIPIVFGAVGDPVSDGIVGSLARPAGNITGFSVVATDLLGKWLELLKQVVPEVSQIAILWKSDTVPDRTNKDRLREVGVAAQALGVQLQLVEAGSPADFDRAFSEISAKGAGALLVPPTPVFDSEPQRILDLVAKYRLPTLYANRYYVERGGLISYGPNVADLYRRAAGYADKILKGAKPSDLPVQQPTKYDLVINRKAANELGLKLPPMLLARADEVIE
jgi:putative tryptophan/tyrosine transport system substrate-binding protein